MKALLRSNELAGVLFVVSEDLNSSLNLGENLSLNRRTSFELQMIGDWDDWLRVYRYTDYAWLSYGRNEAKPSMIYYISWHTNRAIVLHTRSTKETKHDMMVTKNPKAIKSSLKQSAPQEAAPRRGSDSIVTLHTSLDPLEMNSRKPTVVFREQQQKNKNCGCLRTVMYIICIILHATRIGKHRRK